MKEDQAKEIVKSTPPVHSYIPPKTSAKWKGHTKRVYFNRKREMGEAPVLLFNFMGCLGDVFKARIFSEEPPKLYLRNGLKQGMQQLAQKFQIVLFLNTNKAMRVLIFQNLRQLNLLPCFDAVYSGESATLKDFSQITLDFEITPCNLKSKLLVIGSINLESQDLKEKASQQLLRSFQRTRVVLTVENVPVFSYAQKSLNREDVRLLLLQNPRLGSSTGHSLGPTMPAVANFLLKYSGALQIDTNMIFLRPQGRVGNSFLQSETFQRTVFQEAKNGAYATQSQQNSSQNLTKIGTYKISPRNVRIHRSTRNIKFEPGAPIVVRRNNFTDQLVSNNSSPIKAQYFPPFTNLDSLETNLEQAQTEGLRAFYKAVKGSSVSRAKAFQEIFELMLQKYSEVMKKKRNQQFQASSGCRDKKAQEIKQISNMLATRNQMTHGIANMIEKNFKSICERIPQGQENKQEELVYEKKDIIDTLSTQPSGSPHFFYERSQLFFSKIGGSQQIEQFIQKQISALLEQQGHKPSLLQPLILYEQCMGLIHTPQVSHDIFILLPGTLLQAPYEVMGPLESQDNPLFGNNQWNPETPISVFDLVQGVSSKQGKPTIEEPQGGSKMDLNERRESRGKENTQKGVEIGRSKGVSSGSVDMKRIRPWSASNRGSFRKGV